jgi:hypothetical protein
MIEHCVVSEQDSDYADGYITRKPLVFRARFAPDAACRELSPWPLGAELASMCRNIL